MNHSAALSEQLLQFSPDALIVVDFHGVIRFANETTRSLLGYAPGALVGQSIDLLLPARLRARHAHYVAQYQRAPVGREMGARSADLVARRADGSEFPAGIRLAPFDWEGRSYVAAAIRDMTDRRAVNEALIVARAEAERANRAKSRFLATASHDLRQPMHTIRMLNASMQKLASDPGGLRDLLRSQEQAIDGASRLLDALLDVSRLESGAITPQIEEVNLEAIFAELRREFAAPASVKSLALDLPRSEVALATDRLLLSQLLQNLLGNAVKYTERGAVRLGESVDAEGLQLVVEDTGIGIPADKLERIFDEYYQVDHDGRPREGVGLGLAIVREVARLLGYEVSVQSTPGHGTKVTVRIPRERVLRQAAPIARTPGPSGNAAPIAGRLLLLEDNPSVRAATELFLSLEGYRTLSAGSIDEALKHGAQLEPGDVLLADYRLGGSETGLDALHRLRAMLGWEIPAVLLSGDIDSVLRVTKEPIGHCRFLSKPVDTRALTAAIAELGAGAQSSDGTATAVR